MTAMRPDSLAEGFARRSAEILGDRLVGVYLHGSAVMGCFNPDRSDIDLIVVVDRPLPDAVKKTYMDMVTGFSAMGPAKGIEMSVVTAGVCRPFAYPTPFELHFSVMHLKWYREDPDGYIRGMNGVDRDLAAHFTVIRQRGRCLCGASIPEVFAPVPVRDYMDSILRDVSGAEEEIAEDPMYLTLNLARVLAYKEEGLVLSKREGGEWATRNLPERFRPLIMDAMRDYTENEDVVYDSVLAKSYAEYMLGRIRS